MTVSSIFTCSLPAFLIACSISTPASAQESKAPKAPAEKPPFTLKVERNEVPVKVVVHDRNGRPVRNLAKDDFVVLDNGKPQTITQFSTEAGEAAGGEATNGSEPAALAQSPSASEPAIPDRFVAFYFDDLTLDFDGAVRTRKAAAKYLAESLRPGDRAAIFTSSGRDDLEFTADRSKLKEALARIRPNRLFGEKGEGCPELSDYEAYLIDQRHDQVALGVAAQKVIICHCGGNAATCSEPQRQAKEAARMRWTEVEQQVLYSLRGLDEVVRRISWLPGQRSIVFVSPGFIYESQLKQMDAVISRAVQAHVVINCVDSSGLFVQIPGGGVSKPISSLQGNALLQLDQILREAKQRESDVLAGVAQGTGGVFFHNNNDFDSGFRLVGGFPQFAYLLVFSPSPLKLDGKYHHLTIRLAGDARHKGLKVQARRGYFAPEETNSVKDAKQEMQDAVFSREQANPSRLHIRTRVSMPGATETQITVEIQLRPEWIRLHKEDDRNVGQVTFFTAVFDSNGNYVDGTKKELALRLNAGALAEVRAHGISVVTGFKVPPGDYLVREVVADAGGLISSLNRAVVVP